MENDDRLVEMDSQIKSLLAKQEVLESKILQLEEIVRDFSTVDKRIKEDGIRVLGFTISKSGKYFHAVRRVENQEIRIYIGKDVSDEAKIKNKIVCWLAKTRWARQLLLEKYPEYEKEFEENVS